MAKQGHAGTPEKRPQGQNLTAPEKRLAQSIFLDAFAKSANVRNSAAVAGIGRETVYRWLKLPAFQAKYAAALEDANDAVRAEIARRAMEGIQEPLVSMGQLVYEMEPMLDDAGNPVLDKHGNPKMQRGQQATIRKYSDTLLIFLAKARMTEFKDTTRHEVTGKDGNPIEHQHGLVIDTRNLTKEQLALLKEVAQGMKDKE